MKVLGLVSNCEACPNRRYYSGGTYLCTVADARIPPREDRGGPIAEWCPLADHPAEAMNRQSAEIARLRRDVHPIDAEALLANLLPYVGRENQNADVRGAILKLIERAPRRTSAG